MENMSVIDRLRLVEAQRRKNILTLLKQERDQLRLLTTVKDARVKILKDSRYKVVKSNFTISQLDITRYIEENNLDNTNEDIRSVIYALDFEFLRNPSLVIATGPTEMIKFTNNKLHLTNKNLKSRVRSTSYITNDYIYELFSKVKYPFLLYTSSSGLSEQDIMSVYFRIANSQIKSAFARINLQEGRYMINDLKFDTASISLSKIHSFGFIDELELNKPATTNINSVFDISGFPNSTRSNTYLPYKRLEKTLKKLNNL